MKMSDQTQIAATQAADTKPFIRVMERIIGAAPSIRDEQERRQAQLLSFILFSAGSLMAVAGALAALFGSPYEASVTTLLVLGSISLLMWISYALSRTARYRSGAALTALVLAVLPAASTMVGIHIAYQPLLSIVLPVLALLFSSIFLGSRGTALVIITTLVIAALAPLITNTLDTRVLFWTLSLNSGISVLVYLSVRIREQIVRKHSDQLSATESTYEALRVTYEKHLEDHATTLKRRLLQIHTAAEIARILGAEFHPDQRWESIMNLISDRFRLYFVGLFLLDSSGDRLELVAGSGDTGRALVEYGLNVPVDDSTPVSWAVRERRPYRVADTIQENMGYENPFLQLTRSEIAIPLTFGDRLFGALSMQSTHVRGLTDDDLAILECISHSVAAALTFSRGTGPLRLAAAMQATPDAHSGNGSRSIAARAKEGADGGGRRRGNGRSFHSIPVSWNGSVIGYLSLSNSIPKGSGGESEPWQSLLETKELDLETLLAAAESASGLNPERVVAEITRKLWGSTDLDTILQTAVREIGRAVKASESTIELALEPSQLDSEPPVEDRMGNTQPE